MRFHTSLHSSNLHWMFLTRSHFFILSRMLLFSHLFVKFCSFLVGFNYIFFLNVFPFNSLYIVGLRETFRSFICTAHIAELTIKMTICLKKSIIWSLVSMKLQHYWTSVLKREKEDIFKAMPCLKKMAVQYLKDTQEGFFFLSKPNVGANWLCGCSHVRYPVMVIDSEHFRLYLCKLRAYFNQMVTAGTVVKLQKSQINPKY